MTKEQLCALAADIEDVLLRFRGDPEDAETLRNVTEELLTEARSGKPVPTWNPEAEAWDL